MSPPPGRVDRCLLNELLADSPCASSLGGDNVNGDLVHCGNNQFCCLGDWNAGRCTCDANGGSFAIQPGTPQGIVGVSDATFTGVPSIATTRPTPVPTPTTTASRSSSSASSASTTATNSPTPPPDGNGGNGGGLPQTTKIGIGVGVGVGAALIIGAVAMLLIRRRRSRSARPSPYNAHIDDGPAPNLNSHEAAMAQMPNDPYQHQSGAGRGGADRENPFADGRSSN